VANSAAPVIAIMGATFQQIRELQVLTGRSLKECKEALNNHGCDLEAAAKSLAGSTAAADAAVAALGSADVSVDPSSKPPSKPPS
jgi:translation elongation factor EF-Ts